MTIKHKSNAREIPARGEITGQLISIIKEWISQGVLAPGCKLPPERELAAQLRVNRSTLRQALKVLQLMGILNQRVGDGTYLNSDLTAVLGEPFDFLILMNKVSHAELFEARLLFEPELAARAAELATSEDLRILQEAIEALEQSTSTQSRTDADMAFHDAIFKAAGNRACQLIFAVIHRAVCNSMVPLTRRIDLKRIVASHRAIYGAIHRRSPREARRLMAEHLVHVSSFLTPAEFPARPLRPKAPGRLIA